MKYRYDNLLEDQICFLWSEMNKKKKNISKKILNGNPKIVYTFEYAEGRSSFDLIHISSNYIKSYDFLSLEVIYLNYIIIKISLFYFIKDGKSVFKQFRY